MFGHALALGTLALLSVASSTAMAQDAPPTYKADPSVYKVIFEDQNFRVIDAVRKKGQRDKSHSHPLPSVIYFMTDCNDRIYLPDGKTRESAHKAGTVLAAPVTKSHSTENIGSSDCHQIFVERK
jgi:hypothetical protein